MGMKEKFTLDESVDKIFCSFYYTNDYVKKIFPDFNKKINLDIAIPLLYKSEYDKAYSKVLEEANKADKEGIEHCVLYNNIIVIQDLARNPLEKCEETIKLYQNLFRYVLCLKQSDIKKDLIKKIVLGMQSDLINKYLLCNNYKKKKDLQSRIKDTIADIDYIEPTCLINQNNKFFLFENTNDLDKYYELLKKNKKVPLIMLNYISLSLKLANDNLSNEKVVINQNNLDNLNSLFYKALENNRKSLFNRLHLDYFYIIRDVLNRYSNQLNSVVSPSSEKYHEFKLFNQKIEIDYQKAAKELNVSNLERREGKYVVNFNVGKITTNKFINIILAQNENNVYLKTPPKILLKYDRSLKETKCSPTRSIRRGTYISNQNSSNLYNERRIPIKKVTNLT